jgi:centromeric protein E
MRLREGGSINKSLLALSNVIYKLSMRQQIGSKNKNYINFRDSKLTRIL